MKLLLALFFLVFLLSIRGGRRGRPVQTWPLVVAVFAIALAFLDFGNL